MESPPSLEAAPLSEDSGLIVSGSFSSDSGLLHIHSEELQESDCDEKSLSQYDSQDVSENICSGNFNTVKKGPAAKVPPAIDPPLQFQDSPKGGGGRQTTLCDDTSRHWGLNRIFDRRRRRTSPKSTFQESSDESYCERASEKCHSVRLCRDLRLCPCHSGVLPPLRNLIHPSRIFSSHNSLSTQTDTDDSSYNNITRAKSDITDLYNVPFDSDIYTVPIDSIGPTFSRTGHQKNGIRNSFHNIERADYFNVVNNLSRSSRAATTATSPKKHHQNHKATKICDTKRHSVPSMSRAREPAASNDQPSTAAKFAEIKAYSEAAADDSKSKNAACVASPISGHNVNLNNVSCVSLEENLDMIVDEQMESNNNIQKGKRLIFPAKHKKKHGKEVDDAKGGETRVSVRKSPVKNLSLNLRQTLCNIFRIKKSSVELVEEESHGRCSQPPCAQAQQSTAVIQRALPSVPQTPNASKQKLPQPPPPPVPMTVDDDKEGSSLHFPTSIQLVKDYGWYWGPITLETSEKLLMPEPVGSFLLRDSSDDRYIFTISFKFYGGVRHSRVEHEQGKFSFGTVPKFKAHTIVEFIENAVEISRSGRYLFFLNLRPAQGPVQVQLLYPVSRFKHVQSLQHMCRFVICKLVRRDLIDQLALPKRLIDYLNTGQYYSETVAVGSSTSLAE